MKDVLVDKAQDSMNAGQSSWQQNDVQNDAHSTDIQDFEALIEKAKDSLNKLNAQGITLKESLMLYESGMQSLKSAQKILEEAKLQYQEFKE